MDIGRQIARYRKQDHMTQEQLSELVGISNRTISKWESGTALPSVDLVTRIASALHISPNQLFGVEEPVQTEDLTEIVRSAVAEAVREAIEDCVPDAVESAIEDLLPDAVSEAFESADVGGGKKHFMVFVNKQVFDCTGEVRIVEGNDISDGMAVSEAIRKRGRSRRRSPKGLRRRQMGVSKSRESHPSRALIARNKENRR